ncbi:hypothetical protein LZ578_02100 [Jeotgalibaca sp. MA1X17-3]|uniref:hypothetical protein n=1 Tax=Jeotgalibaca sp. MA1X17-3 TaxID=2908211 RepID=UPI001F2F6264|nr:hypothetical protein [Jeotgalibaca sp. MA1X17-3]UJF15960.1 hypothetical protein LZ578_02100 [Jeotgalibaca sp. MA1X17-3]
MNYDSLALEWLRKHLGHTVKINEIGYESTMFDYDELDKTLVPEKYVSIFKKYKQIQAHVYLYDSILIYMLLPFNQAVPTFILIGLVDNDFLIRYQLIKGEE